MVCGRETFRSTLARDSGYVTDHLPGGVDLPHSMGHALDGAATTGIACPVQNTASPMATP